MVENPTALIVGAGPTGMTMAIELARFGVAARVIEQSTHLAEYSQALVVQARTLEQFQRYGIASTAVVKGRKITHATFHSEGKAILSISLDLIPSRYPYALFLPQNITEEILNQHMNSLGVVAERGVELTAFESRGERIFASIRHADGRAERVNARWLIGCDGAHSAVRGLCGIPFEGQTVGLSFFLGDFEVDGLGTPGDELNLYLHSGEVVFLGQLPGGLTRVIVVSESGERGITPDNLTVEFFQAAIDRAGIRARLKSAAWMTPFHVNDRQAKHYRAGNAFLAGDAAHIHSPVAGQGMNTGIQDAANLAWKLAAVARGADAKLLDSYEEERGEVGKALLRFTSRGLTLATISNPALEKVRDALLPLVAKFSKVQRDAIGFISETAIHYRDSSIVMDGGGDGTLRAGDRMPDFDIAGGGTLLGDWTDGRHLAIPLCDSAAAEVLLARQLTQAGIRALRPVNLNETTRASLGTESKLFIVRPDGYIGFRASLADEKLRAKYIEQERLAAPGRTSAAG